MTEQPLQESVPLRPGQMWQGTYAPKYHIIAIYGDTVWTLMHMPGVSAGRQRTEPENRTRDFFAGMRCLYDPGSRDSGAAGGSYDCPACDAGRREPYWINDYGQVCGGRLLGGPDA